MGYYANGGGVIRTKQGVSIPENVLDLFRNTFDTCVADNEIQAAFYDSKYYADEVYDALDAISPYAEDGDIYFVGDDDFHWKFKISNGSWTEVCGKIVYADEYKEEFDEILGKFQDYVCNDAIAADPEYVRMALDAVGINKENAGKYGFDYLFDGEEE